MKKDAYKILQEFELNIPQIFLIDDINLQPKEKKYYLRFSNGSGINNRVITGSQFLNEIEFYINNFENGNLLKIESTYEMTCGGITFIGDNFVYTELVQGNAIALLRRGYCGARNIYTSDVFLTIPVFQNWEAKQLSNEQYLYQPIGIIGKEKLNTWLEKLYDVLPVETNNMLFEWFISNNEVYFCDAMKEFDKYNEMSFREIIGNDKIEILKRFDNQLSMTKIIDCFDVDYGLKINDLTSILCFNGAMLSHYITRNINMFINLNLEIINYERSRN